MSYFTIGAIGFALCFSAWFLKGAVYTRKFPSAPGARTASWTSLWYLFKVWGGHFEQWDIRQHASGAVKVVQVAPRTYSIDDPTAIPLIYGISNALPKTSWYSAFADPRVPNHNMFSATDRKVHSAIRRRLGNMYSLSSIKNYEPYVDDCIDILLKRFDEFAATGEEVDLQHWMQCYAFDVIGEITFGKRVGFLEGGGKDIDSIIQTLRNGAPFSTLAGIAPALVPLFILIYGLPTQGLIAFAKQMAAKGTSKKADGRETFQEKLDQVIAKHDPPEWEVIRMTNSALMGNVGAGSDTTSISLTATLYYLTTTPGVADSLRAELNEERMTFDQAQKSPYLQRVIKEALRIHPAVGLPLWREVVGEGLTVSQTYFPPGSIIGINPWVIHRNHSVFGPDPAKFRPERWVSSTPEMEKSYMPFGHGSRTCAGKHISHLEMMKLVPELVKRYDFDFVEDGGELQFTNLWFTTPKPLRVRIRRRTYGDGKRRTAE